MVSGVGVMVVSAVMFLPGAEDDWVMLSLGVFVRPWGGEWCASSPHGMGGG